MSQEIEIEFKNLLTSDEFMNIKEIFQLKDEQFFLQENHYFDTPQFSLKELGAALRIRKKQNQFVMTLKEPAEVGILETHQMITEESAQKMIKTGNLENGQVTERLTSLGINKKDMSYFGTLSTLRAEINYQNGLLVIDHSRYLNIEDFELEYEVTDEQEGKKVFLNLLKELNIPFRETKNKIRRFYEQKYSEMR
ncbi:CYTH domain-containing protein [Bacillus sp. UMB0899]|uniref:CYTH domain-containing protein n=1 Tax=Metabacillus schmidteae TaxID=2730405 RepID=UPI000C804D46|nr:CYTH domain-containing protein [Metabacillus schmidteae]PMC40421.1 CYTH domain-containing protein [Bacillus sp. UMB0899]